MIYFIAGLIIGIGIEYMIGHIKAMAYCTKELIRTFEDKGLHE